MSKRILSLTNIDAHIKTDDAAGNSSTIGLTTDLLGYNEVLTGAGDSYGVSNAFAMGASALTVNSLVGTIYVGAFVYGSGISQNVTVASVTGSGPYTVNLTGNTAPVAVLGVSGSNIITVSSAIGIVPGQTISGTNVGTGSTVVLSVDYLRNQVTLSTVNSGTVALGTALTITNPTTSTTNFNSPTCTATGGTYTAATTSLTLTVTTGSAVAGQFISGAGLDSGTKIISTSGATGSITVVLSKPFISGGTVSGNYFLSSQSVSINSITWSGGGSSTTVTGTRQGVTIFSMLTAYSGALSLVGDNFFDNVNQNADLVVSTSAGASAQCWIRIKKVEGYGTKVQFEQFSIYDNAGVFSS